MTVLCDIGTLFYIVPVSESFKSVEDVPDYIANAVPYFLLMVVLEMIYGKIKKQSLYSTKDVILSISLGVVQVLFGLWIKELVFIPYGLVLEYFAPSRAAFIAKYVPVLLTIPEQHKSNVLFFCGLFGVDLGYYLYHRFAHEWHILWSSHSVHHSGERYNFATALRQGTFQQAASWLFYLPLAAMGLPMVDFVRHSRLNTVYQFWIHTEVIGRLPSIIELFFNTPSHHRMHHRPPGNCNYAGVFIIWDRIFGTFHPESGWPPERTTATNLFRKGTQNVSAEQTVPSDKDLTEVEVLCARRGVVYGLARPLNTFDPVYANIQHAVRMSEPSIGSSAWGHNRILKFLSMCVKRRAHHPWRVVTSWKELAPDILNDFNVTNESCVLELPPNVDASLHLLPSRDADFVRGRAAREGKPLSVEVFVLVVTQFLLTLAVSFLIMLQFNKFLDGAVDNVYKIVAAACAACVLSLQTIKLYY